MAIKKKHLKTKNVYKVTFSIPLEISKEFKTASLVGDFNQWDPKKHKMRKSKKTGEFKINVELPSGKKYKFRYLLDGVQWINDDEADDYIQTHFGDAKDCLIVLE